MKQIAIVLALFCSIVAKADAWDNLTREEAEKVVEHLKAHPFIFDYCDCCQDEPYPTEIYLLKVTDASIVPCDWDAEKFSVKIESEMMALVSYNERGVDSEKLLFPEAEADPSSIVYMNYTWVWNPKDKNASPVFDVVEYNTYGEDPEPCKAKFVYPHPKLFKGFPAAKTYKKWYKSAMN